MLPKRLLAFLLLLTLAAMSGLRAQWVKAKGPTGTTVYTLIQSGTYFFAGTQNGIFRSSDSGVSWTLSSDGLPSDTSGQYYPTHTIITKDSLLFASSNGRGGVFRSMDYGESWMLIGLTDTCIANFAIVGSNLLAATCSAGVFRSSDNGLNWVPSREGIDDSIGNILQAVGPLLVYTPSSPSGKIYISGDSGLTWKKVFESDSVYFTDFAAIGHDLFAGTSRGIFLSTDSGKRWAQQADSGLTRWVLSLASEGQNLFASTESVFDTDRSALYRSTDSGKTWHVTSLNVGGALTLLFSGSKLLAGMWGEGVYYSTDSGANWTSARGFPYLSTTSDLATDYYPFISINRSLIAQGTNVFIITAKGVFRSSDNGDAWAPANPGPLNLNAGQFAELDTNIFVCSTYIKGVYVTSADETQWREAADSGINEEGGSALFALGTNLFVGTTNLIAGTIDTGAHVFNSTNKGASWTSRGPHDIHPISFASLGTTLFSESSFCVSGLYQVTCYFQIYRSFDSGSTWSFSSNGLPDSFSPVLAAVGTNLIAADGPNLFLSTDTGTSWTSINSKLPSVNSFVVVNTNIFAAVKGGVYLSKDYGATWSNVTRNLSDTNVVALTVSDSLLFAGTDAGLWRRPLSDFGISAVSELQPIPAETIRSYPNPFSLSTTISFTSETAGYADVSIVNALGTEAARLFYGELSPGEHRFTWSNPSVPDGMYECVVRMNGQVEKAGLVLMR